MCDFECRQSTARNHWGCPAEHEHPSIRPCCNRPDPAPHTHTEPAPAHVCRLNLDLLSAVLTMPSEGDNSVLVEAGCRVHDLNAQLLDGGYALENTGA